MNMKNANTGNENAAATSAKQIGVIARYTLLDYMRSRRFIILCAFVLGISIIMIGLIGNATFLLEAILPFIALFSGILFGSDAIAGEFQNKTGYFSIPNPIRRVSIYLGKWIAAFIAASIVLAIFTIITLSIGFYFDNILPEFGLSVLFSWFFLAGALGCVFFFSTLSKSITISIFLDLIILVWANMMIQDIAGLIPFEPWFLLTYGGQIIESILTIPYPAHQTIGPNSLYLKGIGGISTTIFTPTIPEGLLIIGSYFIITMILGIIFFERKEL